MAIESDADRLAYLDDDEFAVSATLTPTTGSAVSLSGIFDEEYLLLADQDGMAGVSAASPSIMVRTSDLAGLVLQDATLTATLFGTARTFKVREVKPDGTGMTELRLHEN